MGEAKTDRVYPSKRITPLGRSKTGPNRKEEERLLTEERVKEQTGKKEKAPQARAAKQGRKPGNEDHFAGNALITLGGRLREGGVENRKLKKGLGYCQKGKGLFRKGRHQGTLISSTSWQGGVKKRSGKYHSFYKNTNGDCKPKGTDLNDHTAITVRAAGSVKDPNTNLQVQDEEASINRNLRRNRGSRKTCTALPERDAQL